MFETLLIRNVWLGMALCAAIYAGNFWLARYESRLYLAGIQEKIEFAGRYGKASPTLPFRGQLPLTLLVLCLAIGVVWWATAGPKAFAWVEIYPFLIGALFLTEFADACRHYHNVILFKNAGQPGALNGKITFSRKLTLTVDYNDLYAFTFLYLACFIFTGSWLFAGGTFACFVTSRQRHDYTVTRKNLPSIEREDRK